jgi:hypothetical protein
MGSQGVQRLLERVIHSGGQTYRAPGKMVIPAYAGIQGPPRGLDPRLRGDDGQSDVPSLHPWRENRDQNA